MLEPTTVCAAHCRWCLRGQYPVKTLSDDQIELAAKYFGSEDIYHDVDEVLITGGDPLMSVKKLRVSCKKFMKMPKISKLLELDRVPFRIQKELMILC